MGKEEAEKLKRELGMAQPGTPEYRNTAARVLASYVDTGLNQTTTGKLKDLSECGEPGTEAIARSALAQDKERRIQQMREAYGPDEDGSF
jgi:hypothetical protein